MAILITGGAGYIGSHTCLQLLENEQSVIVFDNFSNSSPIALERVEKITGKSMTVVEGDVRDIQALRTLFENHKIDSVIHFAGLKAVGDSCLFPIRYYETNVQGTLNLLKVMSEYNVKEFVFSSTATVYGEPEAIPVKESAPLEAKSPYARSKLMVEDMLRDIYRSDSSWKIAILRYFNPIGAHESGLIGEDPNGVPNNLLPYIAQVAVGRLARLSIFGADYPTPDGTGVRDYIHVMDLADGHIAALNALKRTHTMLTVNLGTGVGYSVFDVVKTFSRVSGQTIPFEILPRRSGDVAKYYADPTHAMIALGWKAKCSLETMCVDTWRWQSMNPSGYFLEDRSVRIA